MLKDISVEIIQKCCHQCLHCSSRSAPESAAMLPLPAIIRLLAGLRDLRAGRICLSGGEPLLHPDIVEIVRQVTLRHMTPDIYSSGVVQDGGGGAAISEGMLSGLKDAGLRSLIFNLPAIDEPVYDLITQSKGHLPLVLESLRRAAACGLQTEIHFVPMKLNLQEAVRVVEFAEKTGVRQVNFLKLMPHGRALEHLDRLLPPDAEIAELRGRLSDLKKRGKKIRVGLPLMEGAGAPPCHAVKEKLYIKFDGSVFGCEAFKYITFRDEGGAEILPGNILKGGIQDIYQNSPYLKRSARLAAGYEGKPCACGNCPVQKYLRERGMDDGLLDQ